ncbi:MAG: enoyl-CoA hydratase, partial [Dehalococcoidia bacterium]|nr:enoyl-CoA hydratase [Dehalococcoidia bacterium]
MADYETLIYEPRDRICLVTLNRPEKLNAWTLLMEREFIDAVTRIANDRALKAMIVTGAGRGFCAGADLKAAGRDDSSNTSPSGDPYMLQP